MQDIIQVSTIEVDSAVLDRAAEVAKRLTHIKDTTQSNFFELCDLLEEAHTGAFHTIWGFGRFGDWIEEASGLDLSSRSAYYLIAISKKAKQLGYSRDQLSKIKISLLKKIFELEPLEHGDDMRKLLAGADEDTLEGVTEKVRALRKKAGKEDLVKIGPYKVEVSTKETIDEAMELARQRYGSVVDPSTNEIVEVSDGKCLELISAEFLADPNNREMPEFGAEHEIEEEEL